MLLPRWVGLCTFWDAVGSSHKLSCEAGSLSHCCLNPHRCFQSEVLRLYFPTLEPWVAWSVLLPSCSFCLSACKCRATWSSSHHLAVHPLCPSLPLPPGWMNVFSLTPWLSDFHTVWFSGISGYFFVFKVVLLVVQGGKVYLSIPPSWPDIHIFLNSPHWEQLTWPSQ